jgi:integrase
MSDFRLIKTEINTLNKIEFVVEENTGEIVPQLITGDYKQYIRKVQLLLDPDGCLVYPQSLYIMSKLRGESSVKNTKTHEQAMLLFTRWLDLTGVLYTDLSEYEEEGAPWQFATFLLENIRKINPDGSESDGMYSINTARAYMGVVINFYGWLMYNRYMEISDDKVVCTFFNHSIKAKQSQHDMLAHTKSGSIDIQMNSILKRFPKIESTPADKKLKPLSPDDEFIFDLYVENLEKPFPLMFRLAKWTGLRIYELATFPGAKINEIIYDGLEDVQFHISPDNGCHTKFSKPRTIEIPTDIFSELEAYYYSNERMESLKKCELEHEPLFLSNKGKAYADNTLATHFGKLRKAIRDDHPH